MRKRITLLIAALMMALTMACATAIPAFAVKGDNPGTTVSGPSAGGSGDPPGTCTERQGQGGGGGAVTDTTKGSCNKLD